MIVRRSPRDAWARGDVRPATAGARDGEGQGAAWRLALTSLAAGGLCWAAHRLGAALPIENLTDFGAAHTHQAPAALAQVAMTVLRLAAVGAGGYLTVVCAWGALAAAARRERLFRLADRASAGLVRHLAAGALSGSVSVAALLATPAGAATGTAPPPTMVLVSASTSQADPGAGASPPPTMVLVASAGEATATTSPPGAGTGLAPTTGSGVAEAEGRLWTVKPGDHLWAIAESTVRHDLGDDASDQAVAAYWAHLVELNRDRLVDPTNPDLLFAGQQVLLPPTPAAG